MASIKFRVVLCRIRLFPTFISKIRWFGSALPLKCSLKSLRKNRLAVNANAYLQILILLGLSYFTMILPYCAGFAQVSYFFVDITPRPVAAHIFRFIADLFISKRTQQIWMIKKGRIQTEKMKRVKCHQILTNWTKMFSQIKLRKNSSGHGNRLTLFSMYNRLICARIAAWSARGYWL